MPPLPNLTAVHFPGVLRDPSDPSRALAALGGADVVQAYITTPPNPSAPRLTLNLRPSNRVSQSNIIADPARPTKNLFLIRLNVPLPTSDSDSSSEDDAVHSASAPSSFSSRANANPRPVTAHGDVDVQPAVQARGASLVGSVAAFTEFHALADFQYQPDPNAIRPYLAAHYPTHPIPNTHPSTLHPTSNPDETLQAAPHAEPQHCAAIAARIHHTLIHHPARALTISQALDRLRPPRFARPTPELGAATYWYRQYAFQAVGSNTASLPPQPVQPPLSFIPGRPLGEDKRSRPDRLALLPYRVSYATDSVPADAPAVPRPLRRGRAAYAKLVALLRLLFQQRPVWLRRALLLGVPGELRPLFKKAIATVAYSFQGTGAFFQACVRYGYDPRKDPSSRKYQVLEVRCAHPLHEAVRLIRDQMSEGESNDKQSEASVAANEPDLHLENQKAGLSKITLDLFKMPDEFMLTDVPQKKNNFFQICDIKIDSICAEIDKHPISSTYDSKNGFFTEEGMASVHDSIKHTLFKMSEKVVGEKRSLQILKGDGHPLAQLKSKVRGRLHLVDVMRRNKESQTASKKKSKVVNKRKREMPFDANKRVTCSSSRQEGQFEKEGQVDNEECDKEMGIDNANGNRVHTTNPEDTVDNELQDTIHGEGDNVHDELQDTMHEEGGDEENEDDSDDGGEDGFVFDTLHPTGEEEADDDDDGDPDNMEEEDNDEEQLVGFEVFDSDDSGGEDGNAYLSDDDEEEDEHNDDFG